MEEKTQFSDIKFQVKQIENADYDSIAAFSCGVHDLDDFFHFELKKCIEKHYLAGYCAYEEPGIVKGVFTLMNDSIMVGGSEKDDFLEDISYEVSESTFELFNRQTSYPAINIGHIGVSMDCQDEGIGSDLIDFVVGIFGHYRQAGCQFVTVDAINTPKTIAFYRANSFSFQTNRDMYAATRRMYRVLHE